MALADILSAILDVTTVGSWRSAAGGVVGAGAGVAIYYLSGKDPAGAAVALAVGFVGLCAGVVWDFAARNRR